MPRASGPQDCFGGLAQLARAPALQAGGQRFESVILHHGEAMDGRKPIRPATHVRGDSRSVIDMLEQKRN